MTIPKRIARTLINSLKGGVVPRVGLPYVAVGRREEIDALLKDVEIIAEGGASFRFLVGRYGSGKSFLLQTIRNYVMSNNFVVMDADLSPERRLQGSRGQGLATYRELVRNMATKTRPEGGALPLILDRWIDTLRRESLEESGFSPEDPALPALTRKKIIEAVFSMNDMVHGYDFARLLTAYYDAAAEGDEEKRARVLRWFRGEYATKSEARQELGVNVCITDDDWYDYLKLFSGFLQKAGYAGLLVLVDELVNIYKIPNAITRQYNYEKLLTMYNDCLQGKASHMGMIFCGTPQCMEDPRRGVYSYEALRSRLAEGRYTSSGDHRDLLSPVIRLKPLSEEELLILTEKLTEIHAALYEQETGITEEERIAFLQAETDRVGTDSHITPREIIRDYIELLDILLQNPSLRAEDLLGSEAFRFSTGEEDEEETDESFAEFEL